MSFPLINKDEVDIYNTPILSWKWRVHQAPKNGNEDDDNRNDVVIEYLCSF